MGVTRFGSAVYMVVGSGIAANRSACSSGADICLLGALLTVQSERRPLGIQLVTDLFVSPEKHAFAGVLPCAINASSRRPRIVVETRSDLTASRAVVSTAGRGVLERMPPGAVQLRFAIPASSRS
jgi:hypothetical protein